MDTRAVAAVLFFPCLLAADERLDRVLSRLAEATEAFLRVAPLALSEETLVQKTWRAPSLLRPQPGAPRGQSGKPGLQTREIVSEYGFSTLADSPNVLHEIRQVISVDGRQVRNRESARLTLSLGASSRDVRVKRRMLRELETYGLTSAAIDLGQMILLFAPPHAGDYEFQLAGHGEIPPDKALIFNFLQTRGASSVTVFEGRNARRESIQGELWVRESDSLPLRVLIRTGRAQGRHRLRDEAAVDYAMSPYGALLPSTVVHREYLDDRLEVEHLFRYAPFRKFSAETHIKFDEAPPEQTPP